MYLIRLRGCVLKALLASAFVLTSSAAWGAVVGTANIANVSGGGLTLTSTTIDFQLPPAGGNGAMATGLGTGVLYTGGGPVLPGVAGLVKDLPSLGPILDFITFAPDPLLHFDLTALGPGVVNTVAVNTFDPNSAPSSPSVGSPYILQATATGTTLTFSVTGIASDTSSPDSGWSGLFTTQFSGVTPLQVQQALAAGSVSSTYSASITATGVIPEPAAMLLLAGLLPLVRARRRS